MVFCLLKGSGEKFGPYFIPPDEPVNQFSYRELLEKTVFPLMMLMLGRAVWGRPGVVLVLLFKKYTS